MRRKRSHFYHQPDGASLEYSTPWSCSERCPTWRNLMKASQVRKSQRRECRREAVLRPKAPKNSLLCPTAPLPPLIAPPPLLALLSSTHQKSMSQMNHPSSRGEPDGGGDTSLSPSHCSTSTARSSTHKSLGRNQSPQDPKNKHHLAPLHHGTPQTLSLLLKMRWKLPRLSSFHLLLLLRHPTIPW